MNITFFYYLFYVYYDVFIIIKNWKYINLNKNVNYYNIRSLNLLKMKNRLLK